MNLLSFARLELLSISGLSAVSADGPTHVELHEAGVVGLARFSTPNTLTLLVHHWTNTIKTITLKNNYEL